MLARAVDDHLISFESIAGPVELDIDVPRVRALYVNRNMLPPRSQLRGVVRPATSLVMKLAANVGPELLELV